MSKKRNSYGSQVAALAPAFAAKALIGDLPKASIEKAVESKLNKSNIPVRKALIDGIKGRGSGRAMGAALGIASAPLFVGGLKRLSSGTSESEKLKGLGMIGASTMAYQSTKGAMEGFREARVANMSKAKSLSEGIRLGAIRTGYKLPMALAMGMSVAAGRKKSKSGENPSQIKKLLAPALGGAVIGAISRGGEGVAKDLLGGKGMSSAVKGFGPKAVGGAAAGLLGGAVLGGVIDHAMKSMEKKSSVEELEKYASVVSHLIALPAIHAATKAGFGYGNIGAASLKTRPGRALFKKMEQMKTKQLAIGIREGVAGRSNSGLRSGLFLNATLPELKLQRETGVSIGKLVRNLPENLREPALQRVSSMIKNNPGARITPKGESVAVLNQLPKAIDMAVGKTPMGGSKALDKMLLSNRGVLGRGLPKAGVQDPKKALDGADIANWGSALGGTAALVGAGALTGGAAIPAALIGGAGAHIGMGGWKNIIAKTKAVKDMSLSEGARGIREAFLPGIKPTAGTVAGDKFIDYALSPGARDFGRMVGGAARGVAQAGRKRAAKASIQKHINNAARFERLGAKDVLMPVGTGLGGALALNSFTGK